MEGKIKNKLLENSRIVYDKIAEEFSFSRSKPWLIMEKFKSFVFKDSKILDLGCGNGRFLQIFSQVDFDYYGIDSSKKLLQLAQEKYKNHSRIKFILADFSQPLKFPDNYFDTVLAIASFHHLPSQELRSQVIKEIWRIVKPGGYFIITLWNLYKPSLVKKYRLWRLLLGIRYRQLERGDVFIPWHLKSKEIVYRYYHAFTFKEIRNLLKRNNWEIIEQYYFNAKKGKSNWLKGENLIVIVRKPFS